MKYRMAAGVMMCAALMVVGVSAGQTLKSGPQVGQSLPGPFHPLNCTGAQEGNKHCLV